MWTRVEREITDGHRLSPAENSTVGNNLQKPYETVERRNNLQKPYETVEKASNREWSTIWKQRAESRTI